MERTHRIALYAPVAATAVSSFGRPKSAKWGAAAVADVNLQPVSGRVAQRVAGREVSASWRGFADASLAITPDMAIVVTHVRGASGWESVPAHHPTKFRVVHVAPQGDDWDVEFLLDDTQEQIP